MPERGRRISRRFRGQMPDPRLRLVGDHAGVGASSGKALDGAVDGCGARRAL